ncbi:hypothetical protein CB0940_11175 [Cercospora beticola]|uniref:Uncharacterized protein n=1 Tax=Cercospora beticola TaxID=122368 RepID=A0A2G5HCJ2_CERBT|nr:hypothetical protein CB0940_11175 [Cercospora beticola]PIA90284.1 hypothetical protein CB0940_11175 [Cercospora beticola]WPB08008.1 hypothetical protein RHO25_012672 [Cercospora beticola]
MPFAKQSRPKLTKTRSSENTPVSDSFDAYFGSNPSRRSFAESKNGGHPTLPRSLTLPEDTNPAPFSPSIHKYRLPKRASASTLNMDATKSPSTTTVNSVDTKKAGNEACLQSPRSPGLAESMNKIDVEQAIHLLQELRKSASPEELVSLHKALLPTKEVSSVQQPPLSSIDEHSAYSSYSGRPRSMRPPGLATRGSFLEDPLRSQEEEAAKTLKQKESKEQHGAWFQETMSAVHARTMSMTSTGTAPESAYNRTSGAFGLGTLRIINGGCASPEPASRSNTRSVSNPTITHDESPPRTKPGRRSEEAPMPAAETRLRLDIARRHSQNSTGSPTCSPLMQRRQQQWGLRTSQPIRDLASVVRPDAQKPEEVEVKPAQQQEAVGEVQSANNAASEYRALIGSPRFEQRWKQRSSHLVVQPVPNLRHERSHELSASPERLHPVQSDDLENGTKAAEGPSQALKQLEAPVADAVEQEQPLAHDVEGISAAMDDTNSNAPPKFSFDELPRPKIVQKQDSGYGSDVSSASPRYTKVAATSQPSSPAPPPTATAETATKSASGDVTTVKSPVDAAEDRQMPKEKVRDSGALLKTPEPPTVITKKKRLSPLSIFRSRNRAEKRKSTIDSPPSVVTASPPQSVQGSPSPTKASPRTLQKRMPEHNAKKSGWDKPRSSLHSTRQSGSTTAVNVPVVPAKQSPEIMSPLSLTNDVKSASPGKKASDEEPAPTKTGTSLWARRRKSADPSTTLHELAEEQQTVATPLPPTSNTAERRRSKSLAGPGTPMAKRWGPEPTSYASCMRSSGNNAKPKLLIASEAQPFARTPDAVPQQNELSSATASVPKAVRKASLRSKKSRETMAKSVTNDATTPSAERPASCRAQKSVEDFYPEWQGKPASEASSPAALEAQIANALPPAISYKSSRADAIPPIPELPADIDAIICKADLMITKKLRNSPKMSPRASARNSVDSGRKKSEDQNAQQIFTEDELKNMLFSQTVVGEPPFAEAPGDNEIPVEADSKPIHRRQSSAELASNAAEARPEAKAEAMTSDAQLRPLWEQHSTKWRQHNTIPESAAEDNLPGKAPVESETTNATQIPSSPSIVISNSAPLSSDDTAKRNSADRKRRSTVHHSGRLSSESDKESNNDNNSNHVRRSSSIISSGTYNTTSSSNPTTNSSETSHRTSTATASSYTSNNGSTASFATSTDTNAKYLPYRPADSVHAERSRALNMARRSCQIKAWEIENLKTSLKTPAPKPIERRPSLPKSGAAKEAIDRYSGGLSYNWTPESGIRGSAGTQNFNESGNKKLGVKMSQEWGLDLTDVPIFLQKRK